MECHDVWNVTVADRCAFVREHCPASSGQFDFLRMHFCSMQGAQGLSTGFMIFVAAFLFVWFGTTSGDFFCPNVSSMSKLLGLTETVAGVTLAALGNGAPDMFATFSAMRSGSGMLALGELLGAALFITLIVVGAVAISSSATLPRRPLIRDIVFLIFTVFLIYLIIRDGKLTLFESISMMLMYITYVSVVVIGHIIHQKSKHRLQQLEAATRALAHESADETTLNRNESIQLGYEDRFYDEDLTTTSAFVPHLAREHFPFLRGLSDLTGGGSLNQSYAALDTINELDGDNSTSSIAGKVPLTDIYRFLMPTYYSWPAMTIQQKIIGVLTFPIIFMLRITIPVAYAEEVESSLKDTMTLIDPDEPLSLLNQDDTDLNSEEGDSIREDKEKTDAWILGVQLFCGPQLIALIQARWASFGTFALIWLSSLGMGASFCVVFTKFMRSIQIRKLALMSAAGFIVSIFWIYAIASELVGLLQALGVIFGINDALMGLTIFALGNSLGDLITNLSIARMGSSAMALGACFGSPMMNILLGVGVTATSVILPSGNPYYLGTSNILQTTCLSLLLSLIGTLLLMSLAKFKIDYKIGWVLIVEYAIIAYIILQTGA
ncbi:Sodium/calcium exchanger protein-domain-containing protein [Chytridium lagenaria]|nr:Sodium/calcium exchanger protein-domain-containing protein [Chytridium lagenaria]